MKIGFIGLGIMGKPMAKNLMDAGYPLVVFNRSKESVKELVNYGALAGKSPKDVSEQSDVIITMLPDSPDVEMVFNDEEGLLSGLTEGKIVIDMSSIDPGTSERLNKLVEKSGSHMLDAPVSGGEEGAVNAQLAIMVGGSKQIFDRMLPVFEKLGKTITHVGDNVGAGNTVKLINQIMVAVHMASMSEALAFGSKAGVKPDVAYEAIKHGLAGSKVLDMKISNVTSVEFQPGFRINLHYKDLNNALKKANEIDFPLVFASRVNEMFEQLINGGDGALDHSGLYKLYHLYNNEQS